MTIEEMIKRERELYEIIEPYVVFDFENSEPGFTYRISEEAPKEVFEADREYRSFVKEIPAIR